MSARCAVDVQPVCTLRPGEFAGVGEWLLPPLFSKKDIVVCAALPSDGESPGPEVVSDPLEIQNSPPVGGQVQIIPSIATVV